MTNRASVPTLAALVGLTLAAACATPAADPDAAPPQAPVPTDVVAPPTVEITEVTFEPDGAPQVRHGTTTIAAQRAAQGGLHALSQDPLCAGADFSLWDQLGEVGNQICFKGYGYADLRYYVRQVCDQTQCFIVPWTVITGSYRTGNTSGTMYFGPTGGTPDGSAYTTWFGTYATGDFSLSAYPHQDVYLYGVNLARVR